MTADTDLHPLARDYLDRLALAAQPLPDRGQELVADIAGHLREALPPEAGEAEVRTVLDRLGTPQELVTAAGGPAPAGDAPSRPARAWVGPLAIGLLVVTELIAVVTFIAVPLWLVGLVLVALARSWSGREKVLGLLGLGTGLPLALLTLSTTAGTTYGECSGGAVESGTTVDGTVVTTPLETTCTTTGGAPDWLAPVALVLLLAYVCFQAWTVWRLTRRR